jgi:hypothetical protein
MRRAAFCLTWVALFLVAVLTVGDCLTGFAQRAPDALTLESLPKDSSTHVAQKQTGPPTLENLLQDDKPLAASESRGEAVVDRPNAVTPEGESGPIAKTVRVDAKQAWQFAAKVKKGSQLKLTAEGQWGSHSLKVSPSGHVSDDKRYLTNPLVNAVPLSLIGRIGGQVFEVGTAASVTVEQDGDLKLQINEPHSLLHDNEGIIRVRISEWADVSSGLDQKPSGPPTLENLLQDSKPAATTKAVAVPAAVEEAKPIRPAGTYVRPSDSYKDPDLNKAWADYDAAIEKATAALCDAINKKRAAARENGDLKSAVSLRAMCELLLQTGVVPDDTAVAKPVSSAKASYASAARVLDKAYAALVRRLTMDAAVDESVAEMVEAEQKKLQANVAVAVIMPAKQIFLSNLPELDTVVGWGRLGKNGVLGYPTDGGETQVMVKGKFIAKAISIHARNDSAGREAGVSYDVPGKATCLVASVAIADTATQSGRGGAVSPLVFRVVGDREKILWKIPKPIRTAGDSAPLRVNVENHKRIRLVVESQGDSHYGQAVWVDPYFELKADAEVSHAPTDRKPSALSEK